MKSKTRKIVIAFLISVSLLFNLCSCGHKPYKSMHDLSMVIKVDIVECRYDVYEDEPYEKVLLTIDDVKLFIEEFSSLRYKSKIAPPTDWKPGRLGIKLTYENGDYEVASEDNGTVFYYNTTDKYRVKLSYGGFERDEYAAFLNKYLIPYETPIFHFINDTTEIEKIEIVDTYYTSSNHIQDKVAEVKDVSLFLEKMGDLTYKYQIDTVNDEGDKQAGNHRAIKIYYTNGDYELIDHNWRNFFLESTDEYVAYAYIGEFNEDEFNALLKETISNNSVSQ
ncbi:MAG: hypothetical protein IKC61_04130 [Clostridia bacterium]|nr:hypothetical protein [Clostridia bacterium]